MLLVAKRTTGNITATTQLLGEPTINYKNDLEIKIDGIKLATGRR